LVDRLWPSGLRKDKAKIDLWQKDIAPNNSLRKWFGHDYAIQNRRVRMPEQDTGYPIR